VNETFHARIDRAWNRHDSSNVWLFTSGERGHGVAKPLQLEFEIKESGAYLLPEPTLVLPNSLLKAIAHALLESGDLPKDFLFNDRETAALKSHLEDMRKIAFHEIGVNR
jgi:hypothetical protein